RLFPSGDRRTAWHFAPNRGKTSGHGIRALHGLYARARQRGPGGAGAAGGAREGGADTMMSGKTMDARKVIEAEAREWVIRMDGGPLSENDRAALQEWMGRSPEHTRTLREIAHLWAHLDELGEI